MLTQWTNKHPEVLVPMPVAFNKKVLLTPPRQLPVIIHREALNRLGNRVVSNPVLSSAVPAVDATFTPNGPGYHWSGRRAGSQFEHLVSRALIGAPSGDPRSERSRRQKHLSINLGMISPKWYMNCLSTIYLPNIFLRQRDIEITIAKDDYYQGYKSTLEC